MTAALIRNGKEGTWTGLLDNPRLTYRIVRHLFLIPEKAAWSAVGVSTKVLPKVHQELELHHRHQNAVLLAEQAANWTSFWS